MKPADLRNGDEGTVVVERLVRSCGADTTRLEVALLKESLGAGLPSLLEAADLEQLETRTDVDALGRWLKGRFGL